jgi:dTDP-4-dehydrorhamnose reductase
MKTIYIAGAGGMLGEGFKRVFSNKYKLVMTDKEKTSDWIDLLDFRNFSNYKYSVMRSNPDYLLHIGAHTSLEYCEQNVDDAYLTNTISVEYATRIANELDIPLFYVSTAGIFDGKQDQYDDWDKPNPLGVYARSKFMGERFVVENANKYIVCRAGWMMGGGASKDKKFIQKIISQILNGAKVLNIVNDKDGTPTYTHDFVETVEELLLTNSYGLYNCVCGGLTSRIEVAKFLLKLINREDVVINPVDSKFFENEYFAKRPPSERLITKRLDLINKNKMKDWRISLNDYIIEYYSKEFPNVKNEFKRNQ